MRFARSLGVCLLVAAGACHARRSSDAGTSHADAGAGRNMLDAAATARDAQTRNTMDAAHASTGDAAAHDAAPPNDGAAALDAQPFPNLPPFGNTTLHADRISFYVVPDLEGGYTGHWDGVKATLQELHALMPDAWIRWDNETGHNTNDQAQVQKFVEQAQAAGVGTIITASACNNYNNMWANRYVTGNPNALANSSILDIANGGFLGFTNTLLTGHSVVKFVETINEPDGPGWFVNDPDDSGHFDTYMNNLYAAMSISAGNKASAMKLLGPSVAFGGTGNIWNNWLARSELSTVSYHTYGDPAQSGLKEVTGKDVYVTEYGWQNTVISPAVVLDDLWHAEKAGKLSGGIKKLFYNQLLQNGNNPSAFSQAFENGQSHFAMRGWFRALAAWVALAGLSEKAQRDDNQPDFLAADNRRGGFGLLLWNNSSATESGQTRAVANTSTRADVALNVLHVLFAGNSDQSTAECHPIAEQSAVTATTADNNVAVHVGSLDAQEVIYVTSKSCSELAN